jgi:3-deoxy-7-phosphoheptulonate synthase
MPSITDDTRISSLKELAAPSDLLNQIPLDETVAAHVTQARGAIHNVLKVTMTVLSWWWVPAVFMT